MTVYHKATNKQKVFTNNVIIKVVKPRVLNKLQFRRLVYRIRRDYLTLNNLVIVAAIIIAMSWAWGSIEAMQHNYELQRSIDNKRQQVEIERLKVSLLEYESKYYQSEEYQELAVRQRMGRGLPGEKQLIVPSTDEKTTDKTISSTIESKQSDSNFQQWMNFLFGGRR